MSVNLAHRRDLLETLLLGSQSLWQPATFRERRPAWCTEHPELTSALLSLDDQAVRHISEDSKYSIEWLMPHLPQFGALGELIDLPGKENAPDRKIRGVGARKAAQIDAFIARHRQTSGVGCRMVCR